MDRFLQVRSSNENAKKMQVEHHYPRSLLFALAFFGATLASCNNSDGGGPKEGNNNPAPISTPDSVNTADSINIPDSIMLDSIKPNNYQLYPLYEAATDGLDSISMGENQDNKKLFLCNGEIPFTEEFDNIKAVGKFDGTIYFVGIRDGKTMIINEKGETIFSGFDEIDKYAILKGNIAVSGKKNGETCLMYNDCIIDKGHKYWIHTSEGNAKNGIYISTTTYNNDESKSVTFIVNGERVGPKIKYNYYEDGAYDGGYWMEDYGSGYVVYSNNGDSNGVLIFNGITIGTELGKVYYDIDINHIRYSKNGENYILGKDGKEYMIRDKKTFDKKSGRICDDLENDDGSSYLLLVKDSNNNDYYFDGEFHELEGKNYHSIIAYGNTPDGKPFFIGGNDKGEILEIGGIGIIGGPLERITCVGTTETGTNFVKGYKNEPSGHASSENLWYVGTRKGGIRIDLDPDNYNGVWLRIVNDNYDGSTRMDYCGTK